MPITGALSAGCVLRFTEITLTCARAPVGTVVSGATVNVVVEPISPIVSGVETTTGTGSAGFTTGTLVKSPRGSVNDISTQPGPNAVVTKYQVKLLFDARTGSSVPPTTVAIVLNCGPSPLRTFRKLVFTTR